MICVYASNTTNFDNNGLAVLDKYTKAEVEEEINGDYTFTLENPVADTKSKYLQKGNVIKADSPKGEEYFIIKKSRRKSSDIEVTCVQISDELSRNGLTDARPTGLNGYNALNWMKDRLQYPTRFSFNSNITKTGTAYYVRKNFLDAIMGSDENSFLNVWGGELDRNKFNFNILSQLGADRGFRIENGKNLIDIEETTEGQEVTRIMPTGRDENDVVIQLPEGFIDSPLINNYPTPSIKYVDFPNVKVSRTDAPTDFANKQAVYTELRRQVALMYLESFVDRPAINFSVDFLDRRNIRENKELGILQQLYLGDIVTIHSKKLNIDVKARLRKYTWDCARNKYIKLELGDYTKSQYSSSQILNNKVIEFQAENYNITNKIKEALGGHVVTREGEILIMNTDSIATATKLWRINLNGIAYTNESYNGNYKVAITMDGEIVANFIKTGELDASLIKVGILSSHNGITWINMENGTFNFADKLKFDGTTLSLTGDYATYDADTGNKAIEITKRIQSFKDWDSNNECGRIFSGKIIGQEEKKGVTLVARNGRYLTLSYEDGSGLFQPAILIDAGAFGTNGKVDIYNNTNFHGTVRISGATDIYTQLMMHGNLHPSLDDLYDVGQWGMCWKGMYSFAFNQASDRAKKYNINELESDYAYEVIKDLKPYLYKYIPPEIIEDTTEEEKAKIEEVQELNKKEFFAGVMADEVPIEMLNHDNEKSVNLYSFTTMLLSAFQESQKKIEKLEEEVRKLGGNI